MNLIIDIGNTVVKLAAFDEKQVHEVFFDSTRQVENWQSFIQKYHFTKVMISSVVSLSEQMVLFFDSLNIPVSYLNAATPLPITNLYKTPQTLGYDRIAAVVGANELKPAHNLLVIDAGTCITYDFIDSKSCYHGGNISPGLNMRFKALHEFTGKLPLITAEGESMFLGNTTETAIRAGVWQGINFEIEGYILKMLDKYPDLFVFLTGGDTFSFDDSIKSVIFADRFLVLKGLNRILNFNNGRI